MIVGIIPARGGSKGVPRKNIKLIAGKPLIVWSIEAAKKSKFLDDFYVSTEDEEIAKIAQKYGAKVIKRPMELATDEAVMMDVLRHALEVTKADTVVLLQPTSPIRERDLVDRCIKSFIEKKADNLATGYMTKIFEYGTYEGNRQNLKSYFYDDGNLYIFSADVIRKGKKIGDKPEKVVISREQNFEIDDEFDFWLVEQILLKKIKMFDGESI
jgi:N-acylneuraminate cytidylyltransferase